jgi:hypothetical protein
MGKAKLSFNNVAKRVARTMFLFTVGPCKLDE